jgi:hypothetical protein
LPITAQSLVISALMMPRFSERDISSLLSGTLPIAVYLGIIMPIITVLLDRLQIGGQHGNVRFTISSASTGKSSSGIFSIAKYGNSAGTYWTVKSI